MGIDKTRIATRNTCSVASQQEKCPYYHQQRHHRTSPARHPTNVSTATDTMHGPARTIGDIECALLVGKGGLQERSRLLDVPRLIGAWLGVDQTKVLLVALDPLLDEIR
jgi:hypothetical protein